MATVDLRCPVCATPLSETRFAEIQQKVREEERATYETLKAELQAEADRRLSAAVQEAETKADKDAKKNLEAFNIERAKLAGEMRTLQEREADLVRQHKNDVLQQVKAAEHAVRTAVNEEVSALKLRDVQSRDLVAALQAREATLGAEKAEAIKKLTLGKPFLRTRLRRSSLESQVWTLFTPSGTRACLAVGS